MAQKKSFEQQLKDMGQQDILTLASKLYDTAKAHVAKGQGTSEEFAILNRARAQLQKSRK